MTKRRLKLRNVVAIAISLAVTTMFSCSKPEDGKDGAPGQQGEQGQQGNAGQDGKNSYLVIFDSDGGTPLFTMSGVKHGDKVTAPPDPKKYFGSFDLDFAGWFAADAETAFDFNTPITDNLTLTAKWIDPRLPYFGKWVRGSWIFTFSANEFREDDAWGYIKVSPLTWTAATNTNEETKDDYPFGFKITGVITEDVGIGWGVGSPYGDECAFFIHKDGNSIILQYDDNSDWGVLTKE